MNTISLRKRIVTGIVAAAITSAAAPALLVLATGTAQAAAAVGGSYASTTTVERPGHVAIQVDPAPVSAPLVWGAHSSPTFIVGD